MIAKNFIRKINAALIVLIIGLSGTLTYAFQIGGGGPGGGPGGGGGPLLLCPESPDGTPGCTIAQTDPISNQPCCPCGPGGGMAKCATVDPECDTSTTCKPYTPSPCKE
ncbi:MAG: hypothetical protein AAF939_10645 [Planctomycetota bacterium]